MTWEYKQFLTYRETVRFTMTWEYKQFLTYKTLQSCSSVVDLEKLSHLLWPGNINSF